MVPRTTYTYKLLPAEQDRLTQILTVGNYRPVHVPYSRIAVQTPDFNVTLYESGKCLVQGKGAEEFVLFVLEPHVLRRAQMGYENVLHPEKLQARMGIDESGKGDFFGPLVIAAAYVDSTLVDKMRSMDVKDSKQIKSDKKALAMGRELRHLLGRRFSLVKIGPAAYNRLYSRMRNVNTILGWAHARAIENLLEAVPHCPTAISDQFGSRRQVEQALMKKGRRIELIQRHHAEEDLAVAAASVIAREIFLRSLLDMQTQLGLKLGKGASAAVREAAVQLVGKKGPTILIQTAKCHFKTTDEVLRAAHLDRAALGPEGQAVSKPLTPWRFRKKENPEASKAPAPE